jgi:hypothetical protein
MFMKTPITLVCLSTLLVSGALMADTRTTEDKSDAVLGTIKTGPVTPDTAGHLQAEAKTKSSVKLSAQPKEDKRSSGVDCFYDENKDDKDCSRK